MVLRDFTMKNILKIKHHGDSDSKGNGVGYGDGYEDGKGYDYCNGLGIGYGSGYRTYEIFIIH